MAMQNGGECTDPRVHMSLEERERWVRVLLLDSLHGTLEAPNAVKFDVTSDMDRTRWMVESMIRYRIMVADLVTRAGPMVAARLMLAALGECVHHDLACVERHVNEAESRQAQARAAAS